MTGPAQRYPYPCPSGDHHAHPGQTCAEYEQWRTDTQAVIKPKEQP